MKFSSSCTDAMFSSPAQYCKNGWSLRANAFWRALIRETVAMSMSTCESPIPRSSMRVVDVSGQSLAKISQLSRYTSAAKHNVAAIIADGNNLMTLQGVQHYPALIQLSARDNSLVRMESVSALTNLVTLNLQSNSLTEITGLEYLVNLQWVCLSGNSIRALSGLSANTHLSHLDLSDNCITELADVSMLNVLKTFLLHGNAISSLLRAGDFIPVSVETLSLAENEVEDLTQISSLSSFKSLTQLSLMNNPCVSISDTQIFDSRPYVLHWCPHLTVLDGIEVSPQERHQSESLFPPSQPHPFSVGQHSMLVQYLSSACPLSSTQMLVTMPVSGEYPENQENINPNNLSNLSSLNVSSLSELEEMIKGAHPLSDKPSSQSDLMQKLKALQLIEQMISTQEQSLSGRQGNGDIKQSEQQSHLALSRAGNDASPAQASSHHSQRVTAEYTLPSYLSPRLKVLPTDSVGVFAPDSSLVGHGGSLVNGDSTEEASDVNQHQGIGVEAAHGQLSGHQKDEIEVVGRLHEGQAAGRPSLQEKREEQLRLLNEKIAQRHSKLPRKTDLTNKTAQASSILSSGASKKTNSSTRKQDTSKPKSTSSKIRARYREEAGPRKAKGPVKVPGKSTLSSKSAPSLHSSKQSVVPPSHTPLHCDPPSHAPPTPNFASNSSPKANSQSTTSPQVQHQMHPPLKESLDISEQNMYNLSDDTIPLESVSSSQLVESEEMTAATNSSDLLDSTSYLIPVEGGEGDETLVADMTDEGATMHSSLPSDVKRPDVTCEEDSFASTLTQAYGFSTTSDFLSTLASPHGEQLGSVEDPSANSIVKSTGDLSSVQASFLPPSTASASPMTADKAARVIQAAWHGFQARKREEEIAKLYIGLNTTKLETCVATIYTQFQKYREELAHQASVVQRQEETIQSLTKQVELLLNWKMESETAAKIKAATIIQKYWRGHRTRKVYPRICHGLVRPRSLGAVWAALYSLSKQVEGMSVALSSAQDVYGTRDKFQSKDFPEVHLPPANDLQLTHFSSTCVLLHWTPAALPTHFTSVILQGYRVYVNGMPEGMVGPGKAKAYIEGLDPKTTYRITVRAVYNAGESCDSNPIIASLDARSSTGLSGETSQKSTSKAAHVHTEQSNDGGEKSIATEDSVQQTGGDSAPSKETLQSSLPLAQALTAEPGSNPLPQTETHSAKDGPLLLPSDEKDNTGQPQEEEHSLSHSTVSDHVVSGGEVDTKSPSSYLKPGEMESCSPSPQPIPTSHTEINIDSHGENEAQLPVDFDSTHLFQLVPKGHHITDETVSVMSNATEEYLGGSSSRDTLSHDRSLTSMIFGARESGDSTSESGLSDTELGDKCAKKLDQSIEQIQKSYLAQLPSQSSHASTSHEEEGEREDKREAQKAKDDEKLHCLQSDGIPVHHSHDCINTDIPSAVPAPGPSNMTQESNSTLLAVSHPSSSSLNATTAPPTFGILTMPHPSPFLFDGVSSAIGSKRIPPSLHLLSDVQLQGELQGLALATTTSLTSDPDILTTGLGSSLQTDTYAYDTTTLPPVLTTVRNNAPGHTNEEMLPGKFSEVAIADSSDVSHSTSCDTINENNEPASPLSLRPSSQQVCQEERSGEKATTHTITSAPLGSQRIKPGAFHVAMSSQQNSQLLLGSALHAAPSETAGSTTPNNHRIPTRVTRDFERDTNFKGKPSSVNIESDASLAVHVREDSEGKRNGGMNKSHLEIATGSTGVKVQLPGQLGESFDPLHVSEKLPTVVTDVNLISNATEEAKTSYDKSTSTAHTEKGGMPCTATSQPMANKPQIPVSLEQQSLSAAAGEGTVANTKTMDTPPSSASSALLASLLLSQLESDLNTA